MDKKIFIEENNIYYIDYSKALWATNELNSKYNKLPLCDVDFIIESETKIFMIEYKNANIKNAVNPKGFNPASDKKVENIARKFYDSLHYLTLSQKNKPIHFIYIVEYPNSDSVTRAKLRNIIITKLPFNLQKEFHNGVVLIENFDVVDINEWNSNEEYGKYPLLKL